MCITFGSPLLGNKSFSQAISKEKWGGNFIHVVSNHDIIPRLLFAPITPLTSQLNFLLPFWHLSITSPEFGNLAVQVSDKEKAKLFTAVLDYLEAATHNGKPSGSILFHPFGNYFFVSEEGALCVDSPVTIIKMMHLLLSTSTPSRSIEDHLKYGEYVNRLSLEMLNQKNSLLRNIPNSSDEAWLELAIQSSGLADKESAVIPAKECLMLARMGPSPALNATSLALKLSMVIPYRAQIEWYKSWCDEQDDEKGYYDSFKTSAVACKRAMKINTNRQTLAIFWNNVIDKFEKKELPHDFDQRAKWVNASQFYKLLFEPLDIAEYYRSGMHRINGHYIKHGRERRSKGLVELYEK
ncbi:hypothetical protein L195_g046858 [Trifolium pratense]|uniref:Uncharacterized protein n=1 Tax=Trifolium pratense TaxID=57577 RepID=A0A2K3MIW8_TRIPR|nr:hypothetical protein L195_g046858 [Trifolium pratense]